MLLPSRRPEGDAALLGRSIEGAYRDANYQEGHEEVDCQAFAQEGRQQEDFEGQVVSAASRIRPRSHACRLLGWIRRERPVFTGLFLLATFPPPDRRFHKMSLRPLADWLVYLLVRLFVCLVQSLSLERCERVSAALAWFFADLVKIRGRVVDDNLRQAFPDMSSIERRAVTRGMWKHLLLMIAEIAHAPRRIHDTNWRRFIRLKNMGPMMRLLWEDRARVLVSAHYGNFELAGYTLGLFGYPTFSVARTLDNPYLDRFIGRFRGAKGQHILPKQGSADEIAALLAARQTLSVLADQHAGPKGCWVDFFGRPASTHKAIALFALSNGAPLAVSFARRLDRPLHYEMGIEAVADPHSLPADLNGVPELTQWFTRELEGIIRTAPDQYWWLHRRWKGEPPAKTRRKEKPAATAVGSP